MKNKLKQNCIESLKKSGDPIIIVSQIHESEAIAKACIDNNIKVTAFCDSKKSKTTKPFSGLEVIHTPTL